ncbi:hypothetical protein [Natranaerobius thermophilus]|uniref:Uncharacterized protein n=1 Tax=Natranaerobius thermophilus (strain ATCC BAA-1301 / DSM 18059 / JW/NM-WN-LF) TaxID=457570 RepID=B2A6W7_NATTJ|nr:hypothetical protein [Natranaerobius thermophilus]ACB84248.1 hypothetical protein Nther_0654 [Natranaerobius thermophilus JW/NM-WN-LF]
MSRNGNYLLVMDCHSKEDFDGMRWIDAKELGRIKEKAQKGKMKIDCKECNLKIEDSNGELVFSYCSI